VHELSQSVLQTGPMATIVLYRWSVADPVTGRRRITRYKGTEHEIRKIYPNAERVEGSREERDVVAEELTAERVQRGWKG
jgi:hypothetical protein